MSFQFSPAIRTETSLLISIAGASGSGKTFSALTLATGLKGDGRIAVIDTEAGRALHYADKFQFEHGELKPPFTPQAYLDAVIAAEQAGFRVIVIDSMSHEYEGEGGILEWADRLSETIKPPKNWTTPKTEHKRMVNRMLQCRAHLIFCLRAEDKIKITKDANGKMVIIQPDQIPLRDRWIPICEKRFPYEMTVSMVMTPDQPGVPVPIKIQDQHRFAFPEGQRVSAKAGEQLAQWARGQKTAADSPPSAAQQAGGGTQTPRNAEPAAGPAMTEEGLADLKVEALKMAEQGEVKFRMWFADLTREQKLAVKEYESDIRERW